METGRRVSCPPRVEALEDRTLMAAQLTANFAGGVLRVEGTNSADTIVVRQSHNRISVDTIQIKQNGQTPVESLAASAVSRIEVRSYGGNDRITLGNDATRGVNSLHTAARVWAGDGDDLVRSGHGNDQIYGQAGADELHGRGGNDTIDGGIGHDLLDGGAGNDTLTGGSGNDREFGRAGNDRLFGNSGDDRLYGGVGNDRLDGGAGVNLLFGEAGSDDLTSRTVRDAVNGGTGRDTAHFREAAVFRARDASAGPVQNVEVFDPADGSARNVAPTAPFPAEVQRLIGLTNAYRINNGLEALTVDPRLTDAARYQAEYMARTGRYAHVNLDGRTLADRVLTAGYPFSHVAENIHLYDPAVRRTLGLDREFIANELADYFFAGWKASAAHNGNLLAQQPIHVGVGLAEDLRGRVFAAMVFGRP